jgi:hypothetical protein
MDGSIKSNMTKSLLIGAVVARMERRVFEYSNNVVKMPRSCAPL